MEGLRVEEGGGSLGEKGKRERERERGREREGERKNKKREGKTGGRRACRKVLTHKIRGKFKSILTRKILR